MSVTLNGNTYTATGAATNYDLIGANGYGYRSVVGGSELFPSRIFNDFLAAIASAQSVQSVSPGTSGNLLTSNGSAWVSSTPVAPLPLAGGTMTGDLKFTDATYDIGKSGATRPRDGFFSRNVTVGGRLNLSALGVRGNAVLIANNASAAMITGGVTIGYVLIGTDQGDTALISVQGYGNTITIVDSHVLLGTGWSTTSGTANKYNFYYSSGAYYIENKVGSSVSFYVSILGG